MAERNSPSAKRGGIKKKGQKSKEELEWEIRVCEVAVEKKKKANKRKYHPLRAGLCHLGRTLWFSLFVLPASWILNAGGILWTKFSVTDYFFDDIEFYTMWALPMFLLVLFVELLVSFILDKREVAKNGATEKVQANDAVEVLTERIRIARLMLSSIETGVEPRAEETKYYLSFAESQKKCCENCAYVGEVVNTTTTEYSDGTSTQSSKHAYYYCPKLNDAKVGKKNVCNDFLSKRVVKAFDAGDELYKETSALLKEQENRSNAGFR